MSIQSSFSQTPTTSLTDGLNFSSSPTQKKTINSKSKLQEKADNLGIPIAPINLDKYRTPEDVNTVSKRIGNFLPNVGSSLLRGVGSIYDTTSIVDDKLGAEYGYDAGEKNKLLDSLSSSEVTDKITGFDRSGLQANQQETEKLISQGKYWEGFKNTLSHADEYIGDSADTIAEFAAGGLVGKVGGAALKLSGIASGANKVAKMGPVAEKTLEYMTKALKTEASVSVYAASAVGRDIEEYKKNNNNEDPDAPWIVKNFATKSLTGLIDKKILTAGTKNVIKSGTVGTIKDIVKVIGGKSALKILNESAYRNGKLVVGSAFFESLQEAIEDSTSQIATQVDSTKYKGRTIKETLQDPKNRLATKVGAVTAAAVGTALSAPAPVASTTAVASSLATRGTVKLASKFAGKQLNKVKHYAEDKATEASFKGLDKEGREAIQAKYNIEKDIHEATIKDTEKENTRIEKAITVSQLKAINNPDINTALEEQKDKLKDPEVLKAIGNAAIAQNNKRLLNNKLALEANRGKDVTYRLLNSAVDAIPESVVEATKKGYAKGKEYAKKSYEVTKDFAGIALDEAQHLETSAGRAIYDDLTTGKTYVEIGNKLDNGLEDLTGKDVDTLIKLAKNNPKVQKVLTKVKTTMDEASAHFGLEPKDILENLDKSPRVANPDVSSASATHLLAKELLELSDKGIKDPKVLKQVSKALEAYANSKYLTKSGKSTVKVLRKELAKIDKTHFNIPNNIKDIKKTVKEVKDSGKKAIDKLEEFTKSATKDSYKKLKTFIDSKTYNKNNVRKLSTKLKEGADLNTDEYNRMVEVIGERLMKRRKGSPSPFSKTEKRFMDKYGDRFYKDLTTVVEDVVTKVQEEAKKASTPKPKDAIEASPEYKAGIEQLKAIVSDDNGMNTEEILHVMNEIDTMKLKGYDVDPLLEKFYNDPDIIAFRSNNTMNDTLVDQGTAVDTASSIPITTKEKEQATQALKDTLKEANINLC